jgi:AraC-like DNA-binding protein
VVSSADKQTLLVRRLTGTAIEAIGALPVAARAGTLQKSTAWGARDHMGVSRAVFFVKPEIRLRGTFLYKNADSRKMGRTLFKTTSALRKVVFELKRKHLSNDRIARHLGVNRQTLAKHFRDELEAASDALEADLIDAMWRAAKRGKVSAIIWLGRRFSRAEAAERNAAE